MRGNRVRQIWNVDHPADIEPRLVAYWARLRSSHNVVPEQHVMVMNPKGGRLKGQFRAGGLALSYYPHHLWDYPAGSLLASPTLYPLAVLGKTANRPKVVGRIIARANAENNSADRDRIIGNVATLANIYLDTFTIEELLRRTTMPIDLSELPLVQEFLRKGLEQGLEQGFEQGLEVATAPTVEALNSMLP